MNEIVEVDGHFVGIHPVAAKELEKLRARVAELEAENASLKAKYGFLEVPTLDVDLS